MSTPDIALTESRTLRTQHLTKVDVLDRVKALSLLADGVHATTEIVADYFGVTADAIKKVVQRNREELTENGLRTLRGSDLQELKRDNVSLANARNLTLFTRRTILNLGQLLTGSPVAETVRRYLLDLEEVAPSELRHKAIEMAAISRAQLRMLDAAAPLIRDRVWLDTKVRVVVARGLGEEPEIDPLDKPLYVPDFLKEKGITAKRDLASIQSWFGRRLVLAAEGHGIELPDKRTSELPNGTLRETLAWTERHRSLFEEVWDRYYAADYDRAAVLV